MRLAALYLAATVCACGGKHAETPPPTDLESAIAEARYAVAADPGDKAAHMRLARLYERAQRPGGALRHYEIAESELGPSDRSRLASLYRDRARARLTLRDGGALADVRAAKRLDPKSAVGPLESEAYFAAAAAALRRGDREDRAHATELLSAAKTLAPDDERLALLDPEPANTRALGTAAHWLYDNGAKRVALELFDLYVSRDGRQRDHLLAWMDVYRWWHGTRKRPSLLLLRELQNAGLNLCPFARQPDELGCSDSLLRTIGDAAAERAARAQAQAMFWRTQQSEASAAWTAIALRAWIEGDVDSWLGELTARVDVDAVAGTGSDPDIVPAFAVPTLLRAAGRAQDARAAFDRVAERAAAMPAARRAVLVAEAAAQQRPSATLDALLGKDPSAIAWRVALRAAEAAGDDSRLSSLLSDAPEAVALAHVRESRALGVMMARWPGETTPLEHHALATWWNTLNADPLKKSRDRAAERWLALAGEGATWSLPKTPHAAALGVPDPAKMAAELGLVDTTIIRELGRLTVAYLADPAVADRLAKDFVDGAVAVGERAPIVAELFARLGDPARARDWQTEALRSSKHHSEYLMAAGTAEAASGNLARADVLFIEGAARSGDAGAANLRAARAYVRFGAALEGIGAGRRALQLTAPGLEADVMEVLVKAMLQLSRDDNAADVLVAFTDRAPEPFRDAARARALSMLGDRKPGDELAGPVWRSRRQREIRGDIPRTDDPMDPHVASDVDAAIRWNPRDVASRARALRSATGDRRADLIAELLAIALTSHGSDAVAAFEAIADALDDMGRTKLADKARSAATMER